MRFREIFREHDDTLANYVAGGDLTARLRSNSTLNDFDKQELAHLDSLVQPISHNTVYRIIHDLHPDSTKLDKLRVGDVYRDNGYLSTTSDRNTIFNVLIPELDEFGGKPTHLMIIDITAIKQGIDVNAKLVNHHFTSQKEIILPRGVALQKIKDASENNIQIHYFKAIQLGQFDAI